MKLLTISNLYPRADQPQRGMFNAQLFRAVADVLSEGRAKETAEASERCEDIIQNICLVPEWRIWRCLVSKTEFNQDGNIQTIYLPVFYIPIVGRNLSWWTYKISLQHKLKAFFAQCDAVLVTWLYADAVAVANLAQEAGKPLFIKVHGSDTFHLENPSRKRRILAACKYAMAVFPNCLFLAYKLLNAGIDKAKICVVPNGVDADMFRYVEKDADECKCLIKGLCDDETIAERKKILFVGNLVEIKGPDLLLQAWKYYLDISQRSNVNPAPELFIIGSGSMRNELANMVVRLGLSDSVTFLGSRPHNEVARWMNLADCLVLTSRAEGMPNVVVEALVSGLPIVATDVGACRELLETEPCAKLVALNVAQSKTRSGDNELPIRIAEAMSKVLDVNDDRRDMAHRNAGKFSWVDSANIIINKIRQNAECATKKSGSNTKIVAFAKDWNDVPTCITHIFRHMARSIPVLWINSIGTRKPDVRHAGDASRIARRVMSLNKRAELKENKLRVLSLLLVPKAVSLFSIWLNRKLFNMQVDRELRDMGDGAVEYWCTVPNAVDLLPKADECSDVDYKIVYYCVDDWSRFDGLDGKWLAEKEQALLKRADVVFTPSVYLEEKCRKTARGKVVYMPHGVEFLKFSSALNSDLNVPSDMALMPKPIIGFYGNIYPWIDFTLVENLVKLRPEWSFVFIGKLYCDVSRFNSYQNMHFIGRREHDELPSYCKAFNAAIIPYDPGNPRMNSVNPIKTKELLAAGVPVVASRIPHLEKMSETWEDAVLVCDSVEEWSDALERQIKRTDREKISSNMTNEDWKNKVRKIRDVVAK